MFPSSADVRRSIAVNAVDVVVLFGLSAVDKGIDAMFASLNTLQRPSLPKDDKFVFHDWVLVRRKGVELGFSDSHYQAGGDRSRWGRGVLLLTQAYFYSGFDDVAPFTGELPYGLAFADSRTAARAGLSAFEASRHSWRNDTWDVDGYRLGVTYTDSGQRIDRIACRVMAAPIRRKRQVVFPPLARIVAAFGADIRSAEFAALWGGMFGKDELKVAMEDGEIDFTQTFGATLGLAGPESSPLLRSITLHRNRDSESAGWDGELPSGLDFEDSPETLFRKIPARSVQQSDSALTGHAVWHFDDYTLHVLYSNLDNRLLRIKLIAPGTWKCIDGA